MGFQPGPYNQNREGHVIKFVEWDADGMQDWLTPDTRPGADRGLGSSETSPVLRERSARVRRAGWGPACRCAVSSPSLSCCCSASLIQQLVPANTRRFAALSLRCFAESSPMCLGSKALPTALARRSGRRLVLASWKVWNNDPDRLKPYLRRLGVPPGQAGQLDTITPEVITAVARGRRLVAVVGMGGTASCFQPDFFYRGKTGLIEAVGPGVTKPTHCERWRCSLAGPLRWDFVRGNRKPKYEAGYARLRALERTRLERQLRGRCRVRYQSRAREFILRPGRLCHPIARG